MSNINKTEFEKIKNDHLPGIGTLYVGEVSESGKRLMNNEQIFDDESNNFHLYPYTNSQKAFGEFSIVANDVYRSHIA